MFTVCAGFPFPPRTCTRTRLQDTDSTSKKNNKKNTILEARGKGAEEARGMRKRPFSSPSHDDGLLAAAAPSLSARPLLSSWFVRAPLGTGRRHTPTVSSITFPLASIGRGRLR